jgi:hypothetical protein
MQVSAGQFCFQGKGSEDNPQTSTDESAHLRRYVLGTIPLGLDVYVRANLIGNHLLIR